MLERIRAISLIDSSSEEEVEGKERADDLDQKVDLAKLLED